MFQLNDKANDDLRDDPLWQMEEAMTMIGAPMYSVEFCARLLAWFRTAGASNEAVVVNKKLNTVLRIAAKKFGVYGGGTPDPEMHRLYLAALAEIAEAIRLNPDAPEFPLWLQKICLRYEVRLPAKYYDFMPEDYLSPEEIEAWKERTRVEAEQAKTSQSGDGAENEQGETGIGLAHRAETTLGKAPLGTARKRKKHGESGSRIEAGRDLSSRDVDGNGAEREALGELFKKFSQGTLFEK